MSEYTDKQIWKLVGVALASGFLLGAGTIGLINHLMGVA